MLSVRYWARFAEHSGSGPGIALALTGHCAAALGCLALIPGAPWTPYALAPLFILTSIFGSAFWMTAHRAMLGYVKASDRVGYTNVWTLANAIALGVTPILVGMVIEQWHLWGFRLCFCISGIAGGCCALAGYWILREDRPVRLLGLGRPRLLLPMYILATIGLITLGLHESNR
jgi:sugar phosphate permease